MPDITREEFLRGLRLVRDADGNVSLYGPDGDHVVKVRGNLGLDLSAYQIGAWIADACQRASRTCATCKHVDHWTTSEDIDRYACAHNPRSTVAVTGEHFCGYHENKEAPNA